jgi:putative DNA primase/helicase
LLDRNSAVNELAQVASRIGLDPQEIRPTIESGLTAGARHPRRLPFLNESAKGVAVPPSPKKPDNITERLTKLGETDTDNAQRFATRLGRKVIFTRGRGWLVFDGTRYKPDAELQVMELAKKTARAIRAEVQFIDSDLARAARARFAREALSKGALERMLDLAKSLLVVDDDKLDADPMLFNWPEIPQCNNGRDWPPDVR